MVYTLIGALAALLPLLLVIGAKLAVPALALLVALIVFASMRPGMRVPEASVRVPWSLVLSFLLLCGWALISSMGSITPGKSVGTTLAVMAICVLAGYALLRITLLFALPPRFFSAYVVAVAAASVLMLVECLPQGGLIAWLMERTGGDYPRYIEKNVNRGLCALLLLVWPAVMALYGLNKRQYAWGLLVLVALPVVLMQSLSAQLGLLCGGMTFALTLVAPRWAPRFLATACVGFVLAFPLAFTLIDKPLATAGNVYSQLPETAQQRLLIWRFVLGKIEENPLFGWGMDTSRAMPGGTEKVVVFGKPMEILPLHPHNSALQLVLELGAVGLVLAVALLFGVLRYWLAMPATHPFPKACAGALAVSFLAAGFSSFGIWQSWWLASLWLAVLLWHVFAQKPLTSKRRSL